MISVDNVPTMARKLEKVRQKHGRAISLGMRKGGLFLQRLSQDIVPVDMGNLRASAFTRRTGNGWDTIVRTGYTASYAVFVHENLQVTHGRAYNIKHHEDIVKRRKYWYKGKLRTYRKRGDQQQAKFLSDPARKKRREMVLVVYSEAKRHL